MKKFYEFKNEVNKDSELYLYGAIVSDKWDENDITANDFRDKLEEISNGTTLNIYVNSPGGEVFVTQGIIAMLERAKTSKNITINCTIDGLGASCSSWLPMICNNIYIYNHSMLMLHKPMSGAWGNSNDMKKSIEILDKLEESMVECYLKKTKEGVTADDIKNLLTKESWLTSKDIMELFNVTLIKDDSKKMVACADMKEYFSKYANVPKELLEKTEEEAIEVIENKVDNEPIENKVDEDLEIEIEMCLMGL